jgi:hypothetical protein
MFQLRNLYDDPDQLNDVAPDEHLEVKITSDGFLQFQWSYDADALLALSPQYAKQVINRMMALINEIETCQPAEA